MATAIADIGFVAVRKAALTVLIDTWLVLSWGTLRGWDRRLTGGVVTCKIHRGELARGEGAANGEYYGQDR